MAKTAPSATPIGFVREDPPCAVIVDEPYLAPLIDLNAGVTIGNLVEEAPAMGTYDPDSLVDVLDALALQIEVVFCGHGDTSRL